MGKVVLSLVLFGLVSPLLGSLTAPRLIILCCSIQEIICATPLFLNPLCLMVPLMAVGRPERFAGIAVINGAGRALHTVQS